MCQAIQALFGKDAAQQQHANRWLQEVSATDAAWGAVLELLQPQHPVEVQYFCANVLLTKVHTSWGGLSREAQQQLNHAVR